MQLLADLTEQTVRQLLLLTQAETLPHLVLTKRRDIIDKIAQARKASVGEVLTQPKRHLAKVLALLLCQAVPEVEKSAMDTLAAIEPAIREGSNNRLETLITADITGVAIEILLLAADQDESNKKLVRSRPVLKYCNANHRSTIEDSPPLRCTLMSSLDNANPHQSQILLAGSFTTTYWVSLPISRTSSKVL